MTTATRDSTQDSKDTFYTLSATPSVGDLVYDSSKQSTGKTITAVGSGTISWSDYVYIIGTNLYGVPQYEESCVDITVNGTTYYDLNVGEINVPITPGSSVSMTFTSHASDVKLSNSSDTSCIPNIQRSSPYSITFTMPNENLTFNYSAEGLV